MHTKFLLNQLPNSIIFIRVASNCSFSNVAFPHVSFIDLEATQGPHPVRL